jgi:CheY-like chemotaxis protein
MVDDDSDQRRILRPLLEAQGWDVMEASDGEEALALMKERLPEVILLDLMMPGMDGFAFAAMLRRNTEWAHIPIIVLTAKDLTAEDRERLQGQVSNVLQKGVFSRDELLQLIRREIVACAVHGA